MEMKESKPDALKAINLNLKAMEKVQGKVGWFESSKYPDGTPVAYAAAINEYGVPERSIPARPFMRPAAAAKSAEWANTAESLAASMVEGVTTPEDVMELLTLKAEGDVSKAIAAVVSPPLSPITILARARRQQGGTVTGKTIGEIARGIRNDSYDKTQAAMAGVSTKPLNDTGTMIATLTHVVTKS